MQDAIANNGQLIASLDKRMASSILSLEHCMEHLIDTIINMLVKRNVEDRDSENRKIRIQSNANRFPAASAGDNQDRPFSPANQRPSVPVDTAAQGTPPTKQDLYLQIPEHYFQQNQYRDDFQRFMLAQIPAK